MTHANTMSHAHRPSQQTRVHGQSSVMQKSKSIGCTPPNGRHASDSPRTETAPMKMTHANTLTRMHRSSNKTHTHSDVMQKSKSIGCTPHTSLATVIEQHAYDENIDSTNQNELNNQFNPLNISDSGKSSLFSIFSEPSNTAIGPGSPADCFKHQSGLYRRSNHKMSLNLSSSTVPEICLGPNMGDSPNWIPDSRSSEDRSELLQPISRENRLRASDGSQLEDVSRRYPESWGYEYETGNEELSNDSIDMGEGGRINFRTGSFMTRYRRNSKVAGHQLSPKTALTVPSPQCDNWALCKEENCHSGTENVEDELNPVLENLISDIDSLDSFRQMIHNRNSTNIVDDIDKKKSSSLRRDCNVDSDTSSLLDKKIRDLIEWEKDGSHLHHDGENKFPNTIKSSSARKRNHPFRWSSLARSNQPEETCQDMELSNLSLKQFLSLKKLAMRKLTSVLEKNIPSQRSQFNWKFPKLLSTKTKLADYSSDVFGVPLSHWQSQIGQPLPPAIYHALRWIRQIGPEADGIFRRAGGKARINELKREVEKNPDLMDFSNWQSYDVADMIKSFFRSLPECLMTNKFSTTLISIITYVPEPQWLETIQCGVINLPDENRLVLQSLLYFLSDLSKHSDKTKMTSINLAVCLSPSLFHSPHSMGSSSVSPMRMRRNNQGPDPRDLASQKTTHICLKFMIDHASCLFRISEETIVKAHLQLEFDKPISLSKLLRGCDDWYSWIRGRVESVMSEYRHKFKAWASIHKDILKFHQDKNQISQNLELFYKKPVPPTDKTTDNSNIIGTWRITAEVDAPAATIIESILHKRPDWDQEVRSMVIRRELSDSADVCCMETVSNPPQPNREMTLIRGCQKNIEGNVSVMVSQSVEDHHPSLDKKHPLSQRSTNIQEKPISKITANVIQEDVIVESLSVQKSRIHWLSKVDLRGLSSDWYFRQWSHVLIRRVIHLRLFLQASVDN